MSRQTIRFITTTERRPLIRLTPTLCEQLRISPSDEVAYTLHFGWRSEPVAIASDDRLGPGEAAICARTANDLLLPDDMPLGLFPAGANALRLGPLVALFVSEEKRRAVLGGAHDNIHGRYARNARELGACLVFCSLSGLDFEANCMNGYVLAADGPRRVTVPLPRVIYDRSFGAGGYEQAEKLRIVATKHRLLVVNEPVKLTKLDTYAALSQDPALRSLLPHTEPLTEQSLYECARKFRALYLKPDHLSRGKGVFRLSSARGRWLLERSDASGHESWSFKDSASLLKALPDYPYLIQQAVDLATFHGNQYDVRVAVQKDTNGHWVVNGHVARLAPPRGVVTSPRSGGRVLPLRQALGHSFGRQRARRVLADIGRKASSIAAAIERHYGLCANLGIDLGVSQDGHVWLIEVNGRPLAVSLNRLNDPAMMERIHRCPIAYVASLDGAANA